MSSTIQKKTYTIVLTKDEDGGLVGRCNELHANSQGDTYGQVIENMKESVELAAKEQEKISDFNLLVVQDYLE